MNEVTLALLPALIPDILLPQTPSRAQPCSSPAAGCMGAAGNQASPPDCGAEGSIGKLSGDPACGTELSPNPRTQFSALLPFVLTAWRAWKGRRDSRIFQLGGWRGEADACPGSLLLGGVLKSGRNHPLPLPRATPT